MAPSVLRIPSSTSCTRVAHPGTLLLVVLAPLTAALRPPMGHELRLLNLSTRREQISLRLRIKPRRIAACLPVMLPFWLSSGLLALLFLEWTRT